MKTFFIVTIRNHTMSSSISKYLKKINVKETIIMIIAGIIIFLVVKMMFGGILGVSLVVIENGPCPNSSMCPTYDQGDMFLINKASPDKIEIGDVIVYNSDYHFSDFLIIHRVVNITIISDANGDHHYYMVSGDNFNSNDYIDWYNASTKLIPYDAVLGKTKFLIPKVGYIRLWMTDIPAIRYVLLGLIVVVSLYLILAPDDKKKKEEEKEDALQETETEAETPDEIPKKEKSKFNLKLYFIGLWGRTKKNFKELFIDKKKRKKVIIYTSILLGLIIAIPILDTAIRKPGLITGIVDITLVNPTDPGEYIVLEDIVFLPFTIHFNHDGSWNKVLKEFTVYGIKNDTIISTMKWYSFYQKEGDLRLGGTLIFSTSEYNTTAPLTIQITYVINYRFGSYLEDSYEESFVTPLIP